MKQHDVYILNNHCHEYTEAKLYGTLKTVTEGVVPVFKVDEMSNLIKNGLSDYQEDDMLILSGPTILGMIAITYLFGKYDTITVLVHDAKHQQYVPRTLKKDFIIN